MKAGTGAAIFLLVPKGVNKEVKTSRLSIQPCLALLSFVSLFFITGEGDVINDEHEGTDVIFPIKIFSRYPSRPDTQTFLQVSIPS